MKLIKTKFFNGPKLLKTKIFSDSRGFLKETFQNKIIKKNFPFDIMSFSKKNVLRGLHLQTHKSQAKLITVTHGKIFDVAVDLRKNSKSERTLFWDDKHLNIKWPIKKPILSEKDKKGLKLTEFEKKYL